MKKIIFQTSTVIALTTVLIFSCKKKETTPTPEPAPATTTGGTTTGATASFTWTENGGTTLTADSAYWTTWSSGTGIRAYKAGYTNYFEVNWGTSQNNTAVGTKPLALSDVTFLKGTATYTNNATSNLNVTAFASNQLSGNFTVAISGGTVTTIAAGFNALPKK